MKKLIAAARLSAAAAATAANSFYHVTLLHHGGGPKGQPFFCGNHRPSSSRSRGPFRPCRRPEIAAIAFH
ncbi:hypothetical protein SAMN05444159_5448 [Bradyrhizobium lablabi]|uniref:Secreted protein n=1 Tax=Bradyrhizobium lablabi TaxID=722472 RepID=A0A1M6Z5W4_9BRAD|nr:hypothetical protein SAMN05444159_5448 [Bradyrhizobium lablabi]